MIKKKTKSEIQVFVSIVIVVFNKSQFLYDLLDKIQNILTYLVSDYEIVIVDNGSSDETLSLLKEFTSERGFANLQVFRLADQIDELKARWVGIENSIGDIIVSLDPFNGDIEHLNLLTKESSLGNDIVFTRRKFPRGRKTFFSKYIYVFFESLTKISTGFNLGLYSTSLIAINRKVVNYLLQFNDSHIKYRNLPSIPGFKRSFVDIPIIPNHERNMNLLASLSRGIKLVTSSSENPLRMATLLSAFGAFLSFTYSFYVVLIWLFQKDVAPGWVSLSIQQSGMFFLISIVLLVLSEYVLEISRKANSGPDYYISDEFTSVKLIRKERLNVEYDNQISSQNKKNLFDSA